MKKCNVFGLLAVILLALGCSAKGGLEASSADYYSGQRTPDIGYLRAESSTQWEGTGYEDQTPPAFREMSNLYGTDPQNADGNTPAQGGEIAAQRKLVKRANLRIRVEELASADASINALMEQHGAYASSTEADENSRSYVIRVPHTAYDAFLTAMGGMGRTLHRSESAEDVTVRYYDLEGRLATKQELLKTYRSYLGKAKDIEEILSVEARIADLQNEIDWTGKELRNLANLVDYATISLYISGPVASTPYRGSTLAERIKELFSGFGEFLSTVAVVLVGVVIYGIPLLLLVVALFWLLFGRIGLLKKLVYFAAGKKTNRKGDGGNTAL